MGDGESWYTFLKALDVPMRFLNDIAYLYHGIPAPDCNLRCLFRKATEGLNDANVADPNFWPGSMAYRRSYDYCKVLASEKAKTCSASVDGYAYESEPWYLHTIKGKITLPNNEDLGKVWLEEHFDFDFTLGLVLVSWRCDTCRTKEELLCDPE